MSFWKLLKVCITNVLEAMLESKARDGYELSHSVVLSSFHRDSEITKGYKQRGIMIRFVFQIQNLGICVANAI